MLGIGTGRVAARVVDVLSFRPPLVSLFTQLVILHGWFAGRLNLVEIWMYRCLPWLFLEAVMKWRSAVSNLHSPYFVYENQTL
jgi:hypothetical protein